MANGRLTRSPPTELDPAAAQCRNQNLKLLICADPGRTPGLFWGLIRGLLFPRPSAATNAVSRRKNLLFAPTWVYPRGAMIGSQQ